MTQMLKGEEMLRGNKEQIRRIRQIISCSDKIQKMYEWV